MAKINSSAFRDWKDGEVIKADQYKQEREMVRVAINDNHDKNAGVSQKVAALEPQVSNHEERLGLAESTLTEHESIMSGIESDLNGFDAEEIRATNARIELFYLNNDKAMRPVTFGDLKDRNVTFGTLKYGKVRYHAFRMFRFEGGE